MALFALHGAGSEGERQGSPLARSWSEEEEEAADELPYIRPHYEIDESHFIQRNQGFFPLGIDLEFLT